MEVFELVLEPGQLALPLTPPPLEVPELLLPDPPPPQPVTADPSAKANNTSPANLRAFSNKPFMFVILLASLSILVPFTRLTDPKKLFFSFRARKIPGKMLPPSQNNKFHRDSWAARVAAMELA